MKRNTGQAWELLMQHNVRLVIVMARNSVHKQRAGRLGLRASSAASKIIHSPAGHIGWQGCEVSLEACLGHHYAEVLQTGPCSKWTIF